jgi:transposase
MDPNREKQLLDEIALKDEHIARQDQRIARQDQRIALLEQKLDALLKRIFGSKSETLDPGQLELLLDPDTAKKPVAADVRDAPAADPPPSRKRKGPRPPRIPEHLPVEEETLEPAFVQADPTAWRRIGEEVTERLDYRPGRFLRHRLVRPKYVRKGDPTAKPVIAALPPSLQDRCTATPRLIAEVVANRFAHHLPYYRQAEIFTRQGVTLHRRTLCDWAHLAAHWLGGIYRTIREQHRQSGYLQIDETPIRYLQPGHGKTRTGYLWTSNLPGKSVFYHWREGRDQGGITDLLGEATDTPRIVQCDGYGAYPAWAKDKPGIRLMGCHAHVRRKFFEAIDQSPHLAGWMLNQIGQLYRIEKDLRQQRAGPALREAIRATRSRPIHQRLKRALDLLLLRRSILPQSLLGKAIRYALNQWEHLTVYLADGRVEIDTNSTENAIRPTKLGSKNWMFIGSGEAGETTAILYTIVENCRRLGIAPADYLTDVLERLPGMTAREGNRLTPAVWLAQRNAKHKTAA